MTEHLSQLHAAWHEQVRLYQELLNERNHRVFEEQRAVGERIGMEYRDRLGVHDTRTREARRAYETARVNEVRAALEPRFAEGTIVARWRRKRDFFNTIYELERGVIEVWDGTKRLASNIPSYRYPDVGDVIVRNIRQDGSHGEKLLDIIRERQNTTWVPYPELGPRPK